MKHNRSVTPCDPLVTPFADQRSHALAMQYQCLTASVTPVTPITDENTLGSLTAMLLGSAPPTRAAGVYIGNWGHRGHRGHKWTVAKDGLWLMIAQGPSRGWRAAGALIRKSKPSTVNLGKVYP